MTTVDHRYAGLHPLEQSLYLTCRPDSWGRFSIAWIGTAKLNRLDSEAYPSHVLERIADHSF